MPRVVRRAVGGPILGRAWLALVLAVTMSVSAGAPRAEQVATADEVKAAFVFNFVKFVEWPTEATPSGAPLVLAVLGNDGIEESLRADARGKMINGHDLTIRRVTGSDDFSRLHLLFIGTQEQGRVADVVKRVNSTSVLTVSDVERFCQSGGAIALAMDQNRVRFDVNLDATDRARLRVSSKLLALARTVHSSKTGDRQ
jgi:hypothetical protein